MLSPEQQAFETLGFIVVPGLFSSDEMARIGRDFDEVLAQDRQGQPFDGARRQAVLGFIEKRPRLSSLAEDDRIYAPIAQLQSNLQHAQRMQRTPSTRVYEESFLRSDSPRIRGMVARLVELGMR